MEFLRRLWREDDGQDLVEYALVMLLVSTALVGALQQLAGDIRTSFQSSASQLPGG